MFFSKLNQRNWFYKYTLRKKIGNQENYKNVVECLGLKESREKKKMRNSVDAHWKKKGKEIRDSLTMSLRLLYKLIVYMVWLLTKNDDDDDDDVQCLMIFTENKTTTVAITTTTIAINITIKCDDEDVETKRNNKFFFLLLLLGLFHSFIYLSREKEKKRSKQTG